jgi:hypothetical protein
VVERMYVYAVVVYCKIPRERCNINSLHYWFEALATIGFTVSMRGDILIPVISGLVWSGVMAEARGNASEILSKLHLYLRNQHASALDYDYAKDHACHRDTDLASPGIHHLVCSYPRSSIL